ncbi:ATP-binding cassette domain-containing protein [Brucella anthropi]|uniref:ATP-binding cassette domain-containing protein n=1 Tax=Brucella anthropi TaxID=529 RepID=UPI002362061A|nr:ATP-binding cassette domain-containing protein [Brucella anthropi]
MSTQRDQGCLTLISAANELALFFDVKLPASFLGRMFELYPDDERFDEILSFTGITMGGYFIRLGRNRAPDDNDNCLVYQTGEWSTRCDVADSQTALIFKFIPSGDTDTLTPARLMRLWTKRRTGLFTFFIIAFTLNVLALGMPLYMNAIYGRVIPASAEASLWTLSLLLVSIFILEIYLKKKKERVVYRLIRDFSVFFEPNYIRRIISIISSERNLWGGARTLAIANLAKLKSALWALISSQYVDVVFCVLYFLVVAIIAQYLVIGVIVMALIQILAILYYDYTSKIDIPVPSQQVGTLPIPFVDDYKANGMDDAFVSIYLNGSEKNNILEEKKLAQRVSMNSTLSFLSSFQTVVIVVLAYYLLQYGELAPGALFATIILSGKISQLISSLSSFLPLLRSMKESLKHINGVLADGNTRIPIHMGGQQSRDGWSVRGLGFSFEEKSGRKVIEDISFDIGLGEKVAIVGAGGSGKTTISRLLLGLIEPTSGRISFNSTDYPRFSVLRDETYYFPQKNFFYYDTLFEYFGSSDDERLKTALSLPFMKWVPQVFTGGIYTPLNNVAGVSVDKMQMLEMCRLVVSDKKLFFLDEPTAFVGSNVEKQFCSILSEKLDDASTLVLFTGRSNMLHLVDRVIYLEDGKIAFDGSQPDFISLLSTNNKVDEVQGKFTPGS